MSEIISFNENTNIVALSVKKVVDHLLILYTNLIEKKIPFKNIPSVFLWGPPGVGKSDGVFELSSRLHELTGKRVNVTDIRLLLFSPVDLRGVPVPDETRMFTDWLKPRIFELDPSNDVINILFLDELTATPQSVQAAAYQITLNRQIGEHKLPDNTIIIAAGNRATDKSIAYNMPKALSNRLMHFEIAVDFDSWSDWAVNNAEVHPYVLGYLSFDNSKFYKDETDVKEVAYPTPRSWMFVSNLLNLMSDVDDIFELYPLISGCIGKETALSFLAYCKTYKDIPDVKDIAQGRHVDIPKTVDAIYAIVSAIVSFVSESVKKDPMKLSIDEINNICKFANRLPPDYRASLYKRLTDIKGFLQRLKQAPSFELWVKTNAKDIFGKV